MSAKNQEENTGASEFLQDIIQEIVINQQESQEKLEIKFLELQKRSIDPSLSNEFHQDFNRMMKWKQNCLELEDTKNAQAILKEIKSLRNNIKANTALTSKERDILLSLNDATRESVNNDSSYNDSSYNSTKSGSSIISTTIKKTAQNALYTLSGITHSLGISNARLAPYGAPDASYGLARSIPDQYETGRKITHADEQAPKLTRVTISERASRSTLTRIEKNTSDTNRLLRDSQSGSLEKSREQNRADQRHDDTLLQIRDTVSAFESPQAKIESLLDEIEDIKDRLKSAYSFVRKAAKVIISTLTGFAKTIFSTARSLTSTFKGVLKAGGRILPKIAHAGKLLGRFSGPLAVAITTIEGILGSFENIRNSNEILGRATSISDQIILAIGGFVEGLASGVDSIASVFGLSTGFSKTIEENVTVPVANWFHDNFSKERILKGLEIVSPVHWAQVLTDDMTAYADGLFSVSFPKFDIQSIVVKLAKSITGWLPNSTRNHVLRQLGVDVPELPPQQFIDQGSNLEKQLDTEGKVETRPFGNSEITDWQAVEKLSSSDLKNLISFGDWDDPTMDRLQGILKMKQTKSTDISFTAPSTHGTPLSIAPVDAQPLVVQNTARMETILHDKDQYEERMEQWAVDQPTISQRTITNTSVSQSRTNLAVRPYEYDAELDALAYSFY